MLHNTTPARNGPRPAAGPLIATSFEEIAATPKTRINVPIISLSKFAPKFLIAGILEKQATFAQRSSVRLQWGRKFSHTRNAPTIAPSICAARNGINFEKSPVSIATPKVTAGFKAGSGLPHAIAANTPETIPNAQPVEIVSQPAPSALDFLSSTLASTPSPKRTRTAVPTNSPKHFAPILISYPVQSSIISPRPTQQLRRCRTRIEPLSQIRLGASESAARPRSCS